MWWSPADEDGFKRSERAWLDRHVQAPLLVVDSHTAGNPTRIVVGGVDLPREARDVTSVRAWLRASADHVRTRLNHEPRGGALTCSVLPLPATDEDHDLGAVIMEPGSYPPMCGHCMIGLATVAAELDLVPGQVLESGMRRFRILTPAGIVVAEVDLRHSHSAVSLTNVDSYVVDGWTETLDGRAVHVDLLYGGDYYPTIDTTELGFDIQRENADTIVRLARELSARLAQRELRDPLTGERLDVYQVMFHQPDAREPHASRTSVVAPPGAIDRSPCGTGSSALLALRMARGEVAFGDTLTTTSIIGSRFTVRAGATATLGGRTVITPVLTGSAFINGFSTIVADPLDDLADGFAPL